MFLTTLTSQISQTRRTAPHGSCQGGGCPRNVRRARSVDHGPGGSDPNVAPGLTRNKKLKGIATSSKDATREASSLDPSTSVSSLKRAQTERIRIPMRNRLDPRRRCHFRGLEPNKTPFPLETRIMERSNNGPRSRL